MSARRPTAVAPSPLPDRAELAEYAAQDALAVKAAARRAFYLAISIRCPDHHVGVGIACWVIPSDAPGAGLGVGWCEGCDVPIVCPKRASYAAALVSA